MSSAELLAEVTEARREWTEARERYVNAIKRAEGAGISPTKIANAAGLTEAAIRQTLKRNP